MTIRRLSFLAAVVFLCGASPALALDGAARRDPFGVELSAGVRWSDQLSATRGESVTKPSFTLLAAGPLGDEIQGTAAVSSDTSGATSLLVGVRLLSGLDAWQTRIDGQVLLSGWPSLGVGARTAFGGVFHVAPGWRLGAEIGFGIIVTDLRVLADMNAIALYSW